MAKKFDVYAMVTDKILAMLEKGVVPWHKPWKGYAGGAPSNIFSKTEYRGINTFLLMVEAQEKGFKSPLWLTFKQLSKWGGRVVKGEHASQVVFWKEIKVTEEVEMENLETGEMEMVDQESSRWIIRYYSVFNTDQTEGIEDRLPVTEEIENGNGVIPRCEAMVEGFKDAPPVTFGGGRAFYRPSGDAIQVPPIEAFENSEEFYSTLFHEFIHSTAHESRCNRDLKGWFGDENYSKEELVAEMGACFMASMTGIDQLTHENSAGYIDHWMRQIRNDKKLVVSAAGLAQKAVDHIAEGASTPSPLIKGDIVSKCPLCSEPWDQADQDEADQKGHCPYCDEEFIPINKRTLQPVLPDGGEPEFTGFPARCFPEHFSTVHCHRCEFPKKCKEHARRLVYKIVGDAEVFDWLPYIGGMDSQGIGENLASLIIQELENDGYIREEILGKFTVEQSLE